MRTAIAMTSAIVLTVLLGACGTSMPDMSHPVKQWGDTFTGPQVHVSASEPESFETSPNSVYPPSGQDAWKTTLVVRNTSQRPFSVGWLQTEGRADETKQNEVVDPAQGCNGLATASTVLPGETRGVEACWRGSSDYSVTVAHPATVGAVTFAG